jgi:hypothetical protein
LFFSKGDKYEGDWESDMRHGVGDMRYVDGTVYEVYYIKH